MVTALDKYRTGTPALRKKRYRYIYIYIYIYNASARLSWCQDGSCGHQLATLSHGCYTSVGMRLYGKITRSGATSMCSRFRGRTWNSGRMCPWWMR